MHLCKWQSTVKIITKRCQIYQGKSNPIQNKSLLRIHTITIRSSTNTKGISYRNKQYLWLIKIYKSFIITKVELRHLLPLSKTYIKILRCRIQLQLGFHQLCFQETQSDAKGRRLMNRRFNQRLKLTSIRRLKILIR